MFALRIIATYLIRMGTTSPSKGNRLASLERLSRPGSERKRVGGEAKGDEACHSGNDTL
jgi:hypothetical protein